MTFPSILLSMLLYFTYLLVILFDDAIDAQKTNFKLRLRKRGFGTRAREPFGLVYVKGRLVGVLEPFTDLYQLAPVSSKRESLIELPLQVINEGRQAEPSEVPETDRKEYVRYTDENYPMILTDFKIDSKINAKHENWRSSNEKDQHHQDAGRSDEAVETTLDSKKGLTIKQSDSPDKLEAIEGDLRGIINDLGLTDSKALENERRAIKRDTNIEDEDLEEGPNNIQIVKATHDSERKKRAEFIVTSAVQEPISRDQNVDKRKATTVSYQSVEEAYVRNKRHETEKSNKSPVACLKNAISNVQKRHGVVGRETTMEDEDYENQFEKNIQQRIDAIEDEVKSLQTRSALTLDNPQRSKRKTSSSLQEMGSFNPLEHPDDPLVSNVRTKSNFAGPNVRTKRDAFGDESAIAANRESEDENIGTRELSFVNATPSNAEQKKTSYNPSQTGAHQSLGMSMLPAGFGESAYTKSLVYDPTTRKPSRKRREVNWRNGANIIHTRKKRAEALMPDGNVAYLPYRAEDEEIDEEGDEFEDDCFDDRSASHFRRYSLDYPNPLEYEEPYATNGHQIRKYFLQDASPYIRRKRHNFAALHGGGRHLAAIRKRHFREAASKTPNIEQNSQPTEGTRGQQRRISDLSDTDLFGALPQSYKGELTRFKRVKRKIASPKGEG